jgi:hypothetical protein
MITQAIPAEAAHLIGIAAALLALTGAVLWLSGVRTARVLAGILIGIASGALAYLRFGGVFGASPLIVGLAAGIAGFVLGLLFFRASQAAVLAAVLAVAAIGTYFYINILPAQVQAHHTVSLPHQPAVAAIVDAFTAAWQAIPEAEKQKLRALGIGAAALSFALAFAFPKLTTLFGTAAGGAALMLASAQLLLELYGTSLLGQLPHDWHSRALIWTVCALVGIAVQWRIRRHVADKSSKTTRQSGPSAAMCPA